MGELLCKQSKAVVNEVSQSVSLDYCSLLLDIGLILGTKLLIYKSKYMKEVIKTLYNHRL